MLLWPGTTNCLGSAEEVLLLKVCCGNTHNEKRTWGAIIFLTVFKANENSSSSCWLFSTIHSNWDGFSFFLLLQDLGLTQGKQNYIWSSVSLTHTLYLNQSLFDILHCKDEGLFICIFFMSGLFFLFCLVPPLALQPLLIIHIFCGAYFFENIELNTYLYISAYFHLYNVAKEKNHNIIFVCLQLFV